MHSIVWREWMVFSFNWSKMVKLEWWCIKIRNPVRLVFDFKSEEIWGLKRAIPSLSEGVREGSIRRQSKERCYPSLLEIRWKRERGRWRVTRHGNSNSVQHRSWGQWHQYHVLPFCIELFYLGCRTEFWIPPLVLVFIRITIFILLRGVRIVAFAEYLNICIVY